MCDVLFITPNVNPSFATESLGTLQLATILKQNNVNCKVIPFGRIGNIFQFDSFLEAALAKVEDLKPRVVSFYTRCDTFQITLKLAENIKARWNDIYIVLGGPQSDTTASDTISQVPFVDFVCCGEGETTIYPFMSSLINGTPDYTIPGLVYLKDGAVVQNPRPQMIENLDEIPMVDYIGTYFADFPEDISSITFKIDVGRGCPFGCYYCSTQAFWGRKYRLKSPARIISEIKDVVENFGIKHFIFTHDMFTFNKKSVAETCRLIKEMDFDITWECSARLDCLNKELIDIMVDANLTNLFVGIETGSKRMQKISNKNLKLDLAMETLAYIKEKGVEVETSFIYGFPEETEEDFSQTLALMSKIILNNYGRVSTHLCTFLPKTEISERYKSELTKASYFSNFTGDFAVDACNDIIQRFPSIFPQFMEYRTELRDKLKYFALFIRTWNKFAPIYSYIAQRYDENRLIDMYYDFIKCNSEAIEKYGDLFVSDAVNALLPEDRMYLCLEGDADYDLVLDCRKFSLNTNYAAQNPGESVSEIYCFDPQELRNHNDIKKLKRCITFAEHSKHQNKYCVSPAL